MMFVIGMGVKQMKILFIGPSKNKLTPKKDGSE